MSAPDPWDWPPQDRGRKHSAHCGAEPFLDHDAAPVFDLHIVTRGYRPPRRLRNRFMAGVARGMVAAARFIIGFAVGVAVVLSIRLVVTVVMVMRL